MLNFALSKIKKLKRMFFTQNKETSLNEHNLSSYNMELNEYEVNKEKNKHNLILNSFLERYNFLLKKELNQRSLENYLIIDIGAGSLLHTNYFCNYPNTVYSIEPSIKAIKIGKKIYGDLKNNILVNDFAEDGLKSIPSNELCFFYSGHVMSHLTDDSTKVILESINNNSSQDSYILFDEIWTHNTTVKNKLFYVRTKEFWKKSLSNFDIEFYEFENKVYDISFFKGFFGKKVR